MHPFSYIVWVRFFCHRHFYKVPFFSTVLLRFFGNSHFYKGAFFILRCLVQISLATVIFIRCHFFQLFGSVFWQQSFYKLHFLILHCGSIFFRHSHFYRVPFFCFQLSGSDFFGHCHFYKAHFFPTLFGSDFLGHSHFCKVPFFATVWLRFFGNSHFINCVFLSCTGSIFFRHSHFYRVPFFIFNCLAPIFLATVIFI